MQGRSYSLTGGLRPLDFEKNFSIGIFNFQLNPPPPQKKKLGHHWSLFAYY